MCDIQLYCGVARQLQNKSDTYVNIRIPLSLWLQNP
jgi:hypothetical protein